MCLLLVLTGHKVLMAVGGWGVQQGMGCEILVLPLLATE